MPHKRVRISAEDAVENILRFVNEENDDSDEVPIDLNDLNGDEGKLIVIIPYFICGYVFSYTQQYRKYYIILAEDDNSEDDISADDEGEEVQPERLRRRQLTKNRLVNSIDSALNINNYNPYVIPVQRKEIEGVVKTDRNQDHDVTYTFVNQPTNNIGRQNRANIITGRQGVQPKAKGTNTNREAFQLLITPVMISSIAQYTNLKINSPIEKLPENFLEENFRYNFLKITNDLEIHAVIGLILYRGIYQLNTLNVDKLFSNQYGRPIFSETMSRNRFTFLLANLSFDDDSTRDERWKFDRFAAFREFFESFNNECMTCVVPGDYLSLDETLYPMRTQIGFKQYNPNKPAKYGLLFKSINAARYPYTFIAAPYSGKPVEEGGEYYIQGTENIVKYLVERLESKVQLNGRNISFDRLYTSLSLEIWLYEKNITSIGTLQINRKGIPKDLKEVKNREPLTTEVYWQKDGPLAMMSYVVKTSTGEKMC